MRCGYEAPIDRRDADEFWTHEGYEQTYVAPRNPEAPDDVRAGEVAVCLGYSARLPLVREVDGLSIHWERGTLTQMIGGVPPEIVLDGLADLEFAAKAAENYARARQLRDLEQRGRK